VKVSGIYSGKRIIRKTGGEGGGQLLNPAGRDWKAQDGEEG